MNKRGQGYGLEGLIGLGILAGTAQIISGNKTAIIILVTIATIAGIGYAIWKHYKGGQQ